MYAPDVLRAATAFLAFFVTIGFPYAIAIQGRRRNAWLAVIGCEILVAAGLLISLQRWGKPLIWWKTPLILIAILFLLGFIIAVLRNDGLSRHE